MPVSSLSGNPPPLVGRDRELAILRDALIAALAGHGSLVLIGGEAGVGKSALSDAICHEAAERGAVVLVGHAYDLSETPPYGPWIELFGRYQPSTDLPSLPNAFAQRGTIGQVASQATLFQEVSDFLAAVAVRRLLILLLEDLHWADPASLDLLRSIARTLPDQPLLILAVYRVDEITRRHPLSSLIPLLVREAAADRLDVQHLTDDALRALIAIRYGLRTSDEKRLVDYLQRRAEGNALFVSELLRALEEHGALRRDEEGWALVDMGQVRVPPLLKQVIGGRVARLGEEAQHLLGVAAVIGQEVRLETWAAVGGVDEDALSAVIERATEAHLLAEMPDGTRARFAHALIRETLYEDILPSRRRRLHRQAGEALERLPAPDFDALAYHFQQAGDERAERWLVVAGMRAQHASALLTAAERLEAALQLLTVRGGYAAERSWLLFYLSTMHRFRDPHRSLHYLDEATRVAVEAEDPALTAWMTWFRGFYRCALGQVRDGIEDMLRGGVMLRAIPSEERPWLRGVASPPTPSGALTFRVYPFGGGGTTVFWLASAGHVAEACRLGEDILATSAANAAVTGPMVTAEAGLGLALAYATLGRPAEAREIVREPRTRYSELSNPWMAYQSLSRELRFVHVPYMTEEIAERQRLTADMERAWVRAIESRPAVPDAFVHLPLFRVAERWPRIREVVAAVPSFSAQGVRSALGQCAYWQGDGDIARMLVDELFSDGPATEPGDCRFLDAIELQRVAASLAMDAGEMETAHAWLAAHDRWLAWNDAVLGQSEGQALWATYHRATGDMDRAHEHARQALAHAIEPRQPLALIAAHRLLGGLATDAGQYDDAMRHLSESLALADACAAPYERALTLLAFAGLHIAQRSADEAQTALDEARTIFVSLGAQPALARADALGARLDAMAKRLPVYPAGLSGREVEVLRLLAVGKTNREIADTLFLSEHTVRVHVRNILTKTETENRTAAAAFARQHGLSA